MSGLLGATPLRNSDQLRISGAHIQPKERKERDEGMTLLTSKNMYEYHLKHIASSPDLPRS